MSLDPRWISSSRGPSTLPDFVDEVLRSLADLARIPIRDDKGGIARGDVVDVVCERVRTHGLASLPGCHADAISDRLHLGVRCEAGRAHTNNDGLVAVLEAAADPMIDFLILVVPDQYKGSVTAARVVQRIRWLLRSDGFGLELLGVAVVVY